MHTHGTATESQLALSSLFIQFLVVIFFLVNCTFNDIFSSIDCRFEDLGWDFRYN